MFKKRGRQHQQGKTEDSRAQSAALAQRDEIVEVDHPHYHRVRGVIRLQAGVGANGPYQGHENRQNRNQPQHRLPVFDAGGEARPRRGDQHDGEGELEGGIGRQPGRCVRLEKLEAEKRGHQAQHPGNRPQSEIDHARLTVQEQEHKRKQHRADFLDIKGRDIRNRAGRVHRFSLR